MRPKDGSAARALAIIEEALEQAHAAPSGVGDLTAAVSEVLAWVDPARAFVLAECEAELHGRERARVLATIAERAAQVLPERVHEWAAHLDQGDWLAPIALATMAEDDARRALQFAEGTEDFQGYVLALAAVADAAAEPYRQQAQTELREALAAAEQNAPPFRGLGPERAAILLAKVDPSAALRVLTAVPPSHGRRLALDQIAQSLLERSPQLLRELAALARADESEWREAELCAVAIALAEVDPRAALEIAREITDQQLRPYTLAAVLPHLVETDPEEAWEVAKALVAIAAGLHRSDREWLDTTVLPLIAARFPERVAGLLPLLARGQLEGWGVPSLLRYLAPRDREMALQIANGIEDEIERWRAMMAIIEGVAAIDPEWAIEMTPGFSYDNESARQSAIEALMVEFVRVNPEWAVRFARRKRNRRATIKAALYARVTRDIDPVAAGELAELAIQAKPSEEDLPQICSVVVLADVDRALEVARTLTDPKRRVHTLLTLAEQIMEVEERWWEDE